MLLESVAGKNRIFHKFPHNELAFFSTSFETSQHKPKLSNFPFLQLQFPTNAIRKFSVAKIFNFWPSFHITASEMFLNILNGIEIALRNFKEIFGPPWSSQRRKSSCGQKSSKEIATVKLSVPKRFLIASFLFK